MDRSFTVKTAPVGALGICHLLVVAGPSGAGKSTFVGQLAANTLPKQIMAQLPPDAEKWVQTKRFDPGLDTLIEACKLQQLPGVVLDYDITGANVLDGKYGDDPTLRLLEFAHRITVVHLRTPVERILTQWVYRESGAQTATDVRLTRFIWKSADLIHSGVIGAANRLPSSVSAPFARMRERFNRLDRVWRGLKRRQRLWQKLKRYQENDWQDEIYGFWESYLASLVDEGKIVQQIFLEPDPSGKVAEYYHWRMSPRNIPAATQRP